MSIRKNTLDLDSHYDLTKSGQNDYLGLTPLFSWGNATTDGRLGLNDNIDYSSPVQIPGTSWSSISEGENFGLATKTDGTLWSWGYNQFGALGQGDKTNGSSPRQIPGTTWSAINAGQSHVLATKTDNTLWAWGRNSAGYISRLGLNDTISRSSPVQIPGTTWSSISAGSRHSLATKTDGTLWSWGYNGSGQLGQNSASSFSSVLSPVQIPGTSWSSISGGRTHSLATKTDGTLWSWGYNVQGQLGLNNTANRSSPVQIPGTTWRFISANYQHTLATKTDNTLWSWGKNTDGALGQNSTNNISSPQQIPGTSWNKISGGTNRSLATKTDGTLWSWGNGANGDLGQNDTISRSSPVQIPGTSWSSISVGYHSLATQLQ